MSLFLPVGEDLAAFRVGDVRGQSKLGVCLGEKIFRFLGMPSKLALVIVLGSFDFLIGLDDEALSGGKIAVTMRVDVDDWRLGERY